MKNNAFYIWDWAKKAKSEIDRNLGLDKEGFGEDLSILSGNDDRLIVVLLSKTQSGKTTFALTLLGVPENLFGIICKALRGKRRPGSSSTPITTEYYTVNDGKGRIGDKLFDNWDDFQEEIENIRETREAAERNAAEKQQYIKIGLPASGGIASRVIELMGLDSKEEWERLVSKGCKRLSYSRRQ